TIDESGVWHYLKRDDRRFLGTDQMQQIAPRLIVPVSPHHEQHRSADEEAEHHDRGVDRKSGAHHQCVEPDHDEDADVLVEVLHGDRMAGTHQHMAAMLEERIHRHDEEAGAGADRGHQKDGEPKVVDEDHHHHHD